MSCAHETIATSGSGRVYCLACGLPMIDGPVPPIYYDAMRDARQRQWRALDATEGGPIRLDQTYIGARHNAETHEWWLGRVRFCEECMQWEAAQDVGIDQRAHVAVPVTHVARDILGTPRLRLDQR